MNDLISPKYQMKLTKDVCDAIRKEYISDKDVRFYIDKWHTEESGWNNRWENFNIKTKEAGEIDLLETLHTVEAGTLLKIAVDLGVDTPDFIPSIATFRNDIKSDYKTASQTFEKAFKQIETHPEIAISLANSALESIIKEIFKDEKIKTKPKPGKTLYDLTCELLREFQLFPGSDIPKEINNIGSSFLVINQSIEKLRSEKTTAHGRTSEDYTIEDPLYAYFIVNSVATVGLFLNSFYKKKFSKNNLQDVKDDDLPF